MNVDESVRAQGSAEPSVGRTPPLTLSGIEKSYLCNTANPLMILKGVDLTLHDSEVLITTRTDVHGVSTRSVDDLVKAMGMTRATKPDSPLHCGMHGQYLISAYRIGSRISRFVS